MFDATKRRYRDVTFQVVDVDKDPATSNKYGVSGIPYVVFLDSSDNVIYRTGSFGDADSFAQAIDKFR